LHLRKLTIQVKTDALGCSNSDTSDGEDSYQDGYSWDTDDDTDEANAADDMIKIIEGDF